MTSKHKKIGSQFTLRMLLISDTNKGRGNPFSGRGQYDNGKRPLQRWARTLQEGDCRAHLNSRAAFPETGSRNISLPVRNAIMQGKASKRSMSTIHLHESPLECLSIFKAQLMLLQLPTHPFHLVLGSLPHKDIGVKTPVLLPHGTVSLQNKQG